MIFGSSEFSMSKHFCTAIFYIPILNINRIKTDIIKYYKDGKKRWLNKAIAFTPLQCLSTFRTKLCTFDIPISAVRTEYHTVNIQIQSCKRIPTS